jgi:hypothetical protein
MQATTVLFLGENKEYVQYERETKQTKSYLELPHHMVWSGLEYFEATINLFSVQIGSIKRSKAHPDIVPARIQ